MIGESTKQQNLFLPSLKVMLNPKNPLYKLSETIDWSLFDKEFKKYYMNIGRPSIPIRLMASLLILKQIYSLSDEKIIEEWIQNPYYQYFSGEEVFQWKPPCALSELPRFRNRIGAKGVEFIFKNSIENHDVVLKEKLASNDSTVELNQSGKISVIFRKILRKIKGSN